MLPGSPSYGYVETAYAHGVIAGYPDTGSFQPGNSTTRAQVAKVIYYANTEALTTEEQQTIDLINGRRRSPGTWNIACRSCSAPCSPQAL